MVTHLSDALDLTLPLEADISAMTSDPSFTNHAGVGIRQKLTRRIESQVAR